MTSARDGARALAFIIVLAAGSVGSAQAQLAPWPSNTPQSTSGGQAAWPEGGQPTQTIAPPQGQTQMQGPAMGPTMGGGQMQAPPMNGAQQQCLQEFTHYRSEVEKRAMAAKTASEKKPTREEMCKLVTAYAAAETKWIQFSDANMVKCGIPKEAVAQIKAIHTRTLGARKQLCSAGPTQSAGPVTPSLSDALGTSTLPVEDTTKKRKEGGTLDTLTGNALGR